jgi:hypothetical protein
MTKLGFLLLVALLPWIVNAQFSYTVHNNTVTITAYTGPAGAVNIPSTIAGLPVVSIGQFAFYPYYTGDSASVTSISIPDSVTNIADEAFEYCGTVTNVTIGHGVISIGNDTFSECTGLINVSIPTNVTSIGASAFSLCTNLRTTAIPDSVTNIGNAAFYACSHLSSVTIPGSVIRVGAGAFRWCSGLTNLTIANGVASIGFRAFESCQPTSVLIPQSVSSIDSAPFFACSGLTAITVDPQNSSFSSVDGVLFNKNQTTLIQWPGGRGGSYIVPNSVTDIASGAFEFCLILTNVTIDVGLTGVGYGAFAGCTNLRAVYFTGNAPVDADPQAFGKADNTPMNTNAVAYYLPGTTGWSATFAGIPTALWLLPNPTILTFEPNFGVRTNNFGFTVSWATNIPVVVEACTNLASPVWTSVATLTLVSGTAYFSDAQWTNYPGRFYRLRN